jgi:hypothetical protein
MYPRTSFSGFTLAWTFGFRRDQGIDPQCLFLPGGRGHYGILKRLISDSVFDERDAMKYEYERNRGTSIKT